MTWTSEYNPTFDIIEIIYKSKLNIRDMHEATTYSIALSAKSRTNRFLLDAKEAELEATLTDIYSISAKQYSEEITDKRGKVGVVLPDCPKAREAARFYETVSRNRGYMVSTFADRRGAVDWLVSGKSSNKPDPSES